MGSMGCNPFVGCCRLHFAASLSCCNWILHFQRRQIQVICWSGEMTEPWTMTYPFDSSLQFFVSLLEEGVFLFLYNVVNKIGFFLSIVNSRYTFLQTTLYLN